MSERTMTEEECLAIGGHCWEQSRWMMMSNPPQHHRACKHCGKVQRGVEQPSIRWSDE